MDKERIKRAVREIIEAVGDDPERQGLLYTPQRVADMYEEIFAGLKMDPSTEIELFLPDFHEEMILVKDIPFYSICEHHLLPFFGRCHVAYLPKEGRITGLSKLARVVECLSKRLQLQERLTTEIAEVLSSTLKPYGVLVVIEAEHLCMTMRGVKKPGAVTTTSAVRGAFEREATRMEAFSLIKKSSF